MIDELEYNLVVAKLLGTPDIGARFLDHQFLRAVSMGSISVLDDETKRVLYEAYRHVSLANGRVERAMNATQRGERNSAENEAQNYVRGVPIYVERALARLLSFVGKTGTS